MIKFSSGETNTDAILAEYPKNSIESGIISILSSSSRTYKYISAEELKFEIEIRMKTISAAKELNKTDFEFKVFRESTCNAAFWKRTDEGGFKLKEGVKAYEAVKDIYVNGGLYGTECATAMVIVFLKAVLDIYPVELYNEMFDNLYLMNWSRIDRDLGIESYDVQDFLPGDCRYFKNPDVNPKTPEWQGENVIDLGDGKYYGHGLGIKTAERMIAALNKYRKPGATETAYLMNSVTRPAYKYLAYRYKIFNLNRERSQSTILTRQSPPAGICFAAQGAEYDF